jgi:hypothetical protein
VRKVLLAIGLVAAIVLSVGYFIADDLITRRLRPATISLLADRFNGDVELRDLSVGVFPLRVAGEGLTVRARGRRDIPPLMVVGRFTIESSVVGLWSRHVDRVHLRGLEITIPPRVHSEPGPDSPRTSDPARNGLPDVSISEIVAEEGLLTILPKRAGKRPRVIQLRRLQFNDFRFSAPVAFEAAITNPTPHGEIAAVGRFGPWQRDEPSLTPVEGTFVFDADLGTIKGIGGQLHAEGTFAGPLDYIRTSGRTRTEGFHLSTGGEKFPLLVDYDAIVDGTNGDTHLERVAADLGGSKIGARGAIVRVELPGSPEGRSGRRITLDVDATDGRLEDFVKLTTRVPSSPMTGLVDVRATLDIPPGDAEVIDRIELDGQFDVARARFTSETIQRRIDELSRRGTGRPGDQSVDDVASNLRGSFLLRDGTMRLRSLNFRVEGAEVRLAGAYRIKSEALDFTGTLRLRAKMSQTQTGWRSIVLKVFDPLFDARDAGTVLPINIGGTRRAPKFGVDVKKALLPG